MTNYSCIRFTPRRPCFRNPFMAEYLQERGPIRTHLFRVSMMSSVPVSFLIFAPLFFMLR